MTESHLQRGEPHPQGRVIDLAAVIEQQQLGRFTIALVAISCIVTFFDGFDMLVLSFVAPYLREEMALNEEQLGNLFGVGTFGLMVGGFFFGWLGDRIGRRPAILIAVAGFGLTAIGLGVASGLTSFTIIRFFNGITLGGLLPLIWALNIEFAPKNYRATVVTVVMIGYTLGGAVSGPVTDLIAPVYGWRMVFLGSGIVTLLLCGILYATLPESPRFLLLQRNDQRRVLTLLGRIKPDLNPGPGDRVIVSDETPHRKEAERFSIRALFAGRLAAITPLLWLAYVGSSMAIYFNATWGPIIFEDVGLTRTQVAYMSSASSILGAIAGLSLMRFTDRFGPIAIAGLPLVAAPLLLAMGLLDTSLWMFVALSLLSMTMLGGMHFGMHSIAGVFYPSAFRANGTGVATSVAKVGSIAAPVIGGYLLASGLPVKQAFTILAIAPAATGISLLLLARAANWRQSSDPVQISTSAELQHSEKRECAPS